MSAGGGGKRRESGLRVTGPRFIRGERSKVIAQARRGRASPAGSFRAATPCGRPHPRRRLVHEGSTSSRGTTTTTTATRGDDAARQPRSEGAAYDDDRPAESRELNLEPRSRSRSRSRFECDSDARGRPQPETMMLRLRQGIRGPGVATLVLSKTPRERGCHRRRAKAVAKHHL